MLRTVKDLQGYAIRATDGVIGEVADFFFDDEDWVIRYLVVDAGTWLRGRHVLISPVAIGHPDWMAQLLPVSITKDQVKNSPDIDTRKPVSRQHETEYLDYYGYPFYGEAPASGEWAPTPAASPRGTPSREKCRLDGASRRGQPTKTILTCAASRP
jgi:hypothetical protein